jgi:hypothetical protein
MSMDMQRFEEIIRENEKLKIQKNAPKDPTESPAHLSWEQLLKQAFYGFMIVGFIAAGMGSCTWAFNSLNPVAEKLESSR